MAITYDKDTDYKALMDAAIAAGDFKSAARYEQQRNAKIDGEGITGYQKTYDLGSPFDAENFTNEELGKAYNARQAYQSGQTGMDSSHSFVENTRSKYGYSGGEDGSQYIPIEKAKQASDPAPTFSYQSAPAYVNRYQDLIDELKGKILDQDPFSYNAEQDPLYQQYRQSYTRGGERAMQDTLGQLSARTGGLASSYAGSAAQQQYDNYMGALADKIPELQQLAYEMYQDEGNRQRLNLQMIAALEQEDYGKYQDLLGQYNADRSFSYGQYRDQIADRRYDDETAYNRGVYADERDYNRGIYADETAYNRGLYADETDYDRKLQRAKLLAEVGDFSGYQALGFTEEEIGRLQAAFLLQHPEFSSLYPSDQTAAGTGGGFPATDPSGWGGGGRYTYSLGSDAGGYDPAAGNDIWSGVEAWVAKYGTDSAKNYIKEHYRELGYTNQSTALAGWQNHLVESGYTGSGGATGSGKATGSGGAAGSGKATGSGGAAGSGGSKYGGDLGIGTVSDSEIDRLIRDKKVETYIGPDGRKYVHWVTGWNSGNYKNSSGLPWGPLGR